MEIKLTYGEIIPESEQERLWLEEQEQKARERQLLAEEQKKAEQEKKELEKKIIDDRYQSNKQIIDLISTFKGLKERCYITIQYDKTGRGKKQEYETYDLLKDELVIDDNMFLHRVITTIHSEYTVGNRVLFNYPVKTHERLDYDKLKGLEVHEESLIHEYISVDGTLYKRVNIEHNVINPLCLEGKVWTVKGK